MNKKINESDIKKSLEFEARYKDFLNELSEMPKETKEDKEARYKWFKDSAIHDDIIIELMETLRPRAYEKLYKRVSLNRDGEMYKGLESDFDIASFKYTKEVDPLVYMETFVESIKTYTGVNSKKEQVPFIAYVGKKYKQNAERASGVNMDVDTSYGMTMPYAQAGNKVYIVKLTRALKNMKEKTGNKYSLAKLVDMAIEDIGENHKFTKNEIETAIIKVYALDMGSFDSPLDEDGNALKEIIGKAETELEEIENNGVFQAFIQRLAENPEKNWGEISLASSKKSREWLKIFLTKDILIALKLDAVIMKLPKNYLKGRIPEAVQSNLVPEPKCGQWCPRAKRCKLESDGCYIRYDKIRENPPYGNDEIYHLLVSAGDLVYKNLLYKEYLDGALINENLEDVWRNKLYIHSMDRKEDMEQTFDFTDATMGKILGKDKSTISHARTKYEKSKGVMYKMFLEV